MDCSGCKETHRVRRCSLYIQYEWNWGDEATVACSPPANRPVKFLHVKVSSLYTYVCDQVIDMTQESWKMFNLCQHGTCHLYHIRCFGISLNDRKLLPFDNIPPSPCVEPTIPRKHSAIRNVHCDVGPKSLSVKEENTGMRAVMGKMKWYWFLIYLQSEELDLTITSNLI